MKKIIILICFLSIQKQIYAFFLRSIKVGSAVALLSSVGLSSKKYFNNNKANLISEKDPEFYEFCQKVRRKVGIRNNIIFKFMKSDNEMAFYNTQEKIIYINQDYYRANKSITLNTIVHELEHYRQVHKFAGSYHGYDDKLLETGADAASAGFFDCSHCLNIVSSYRSVEYDDGYFNTIDYDCYKKRLLENPKECDGCQKKKQGLEPNWSDYVSFSIENKSKQWFWS